MIKLKQGGRELEQVVVHFGAHPHLRLIVRLDQILPQFNVSDRVEIQSLRQFLFQVVAAITITIAIGILEHLVTAVG